MKYIYTLLTIALLYSSCAFGLSLNLTGPNFPIFMVVGGPAATVSYKLFNSTGGPFGVSVSDITQLPITSTVTLSSSSANNCANLQAEQTCTITITLNPETAASIQDIVQTGPLILVPFGPINQPIAPTKSQQISVRVFPSHHHFG